MHIRRAEIEIVVNSTPVTDAHTHLFPPEFNELCLFGIDELLTAISEAIGGDMMSTTLTLSPAQGKQRARLYRLGVVKDESTSDDGNVRLRLQMPRADLLRLIPEEGLDVAAFDPAPHADVPVPHENSGIAPVDDADLFR